MLFTNRDLMNVTFALIVLFVPISTTIYLCYWRYFSPMLPQNGKEKNLRAQLNYLLGKRIKTSHDLRTISRLRVSLSKFKPHYDRDKRNVYQPQVGTERARRAQLMSQFDMFFLQFAWMGLGMWQRQEARDFEYGRLTTKLYIDEKIASIKSAFNTADHYITSTGVKPFLGFDMANLERYTLLFLSIGDSKSYVGITSAVLQFIKTEYKTSMTTVTWELVSNYLSPVEPQSTEDLLKSMSLFRENFSKFTSTKLFSHFKRILSLLVGLGYCEFFTVPFTIEGVEIFDATCAPTKTNALDAVTLFLDTVEEMGRVFSSCFRTRSLKPFLFSDGESMTVETLYLDLVELTPYMINGDLESADSTPEDYWTKIDKLNNMLLAMHAGANHPVEKSLIFTKLVTVRKWISEYNVVQNAGALREAPFSFCFYGQSGIGKTTSANLLNISILKANGFSCDPTKIVTFNENDKYFSNYRSDVVTIVLDDICNTKTDMLETSPLVPLLKFKNNNPEYAVMADLASKGKISVRPKTLLLTTNIPTLNAGDFSNEPLSMMRRIDMHIGASVKPQFRKAGTHFLDSEKAHAYVDTLVGEDKHFPELWDFLVVRAVPHSSAASDKFVSFVNIVDDKPVVSLTDMESGDTRIGLKHLIRLGISMSKDHFAAQKKVVRNANTLHQEITLCTECGMPSACCMCPVDITHTPHAGLGSDTLAERVEYYHNLQNLGVYPYLAYWFLSYPLFRVCLFLSRPRFWVEYLRCRVYQHIVLLSLLYFCFKHFYYIYVPYLLGDGIYIASIMLREYDLCVRNYSLMPNYFRQLSQRVRNTNTVWLFGGGAVIAALMSAYGMFKRARLATTHSGLSPSTPEELEVKLHTASQWDRTTLSSIPATLHAKTTTTDRALTKIAKNVVYVRYLSADTTITTTNGFFVNSNILLIPLHNIKEKDFKLEIIRGEAHTPHYKFTTKVSDTNIYKFPDKDFALVYISNGGDWSNMIPYFPLDTPRDCGFVMPYRDISGGLTTFKGKTANKEVNNGYRKFPGSYYNLQKPTFNGLCMAPLISDTVSNVVLGFHLGGVTGTSRGCSGMLLASDLETAISHLKASMDIPIATGEGTMNPNRYGVTALQSTTLEKHSPINYLDPYLPIDVYGTCIGGASYYTSVMDSPISKLVETHCGSENIYSGPKFGPEKWKPWYTALEGYGDIGIGPFPSSVQWALTDYMKPLLQKVDDFDLFKKLKPLSNEEVVNGIDGLRFVDRMARDKSVGFPLTGPLSDYMIHDDETGEEIGIDEKFWKEVSFMEENARAGVRSYPTFKATLKDEVTKKSKDKVRVFTAASLAHKLILRKYFLPIALILCSDPAASECAVGINAYGPEWDDLVAHVAAFGDDRMVAGDFKAYDQKLMPSITRAAFAVFVRLARKCSYTEEDIVIMEHLVADVAHASVAYNGTLLQLAGANPSGNTLTVFINGCGNSLLHRCAYYDEAILQKISVIPPFREMVRAMFYGDDSTGSVNKECNWFDNRIMCKWMEEYGMTYTTPDKAAEHPQFRPKGEVSFLKRDSRWDPEIRHYVGALEQNSIFKSLHCVMKSQFMTPEELSAVNIDNALREFFLHGREVYEHRRLQLNIVAEKAELTHHCSNLNKTFDDCLLAWREKYYPDYGPGDLPPSGTQAVF